MDVSKGTRSFFPGDRIKVKDELKADLVAKNKRTDIFDSGFPEELINLIFIG